LEPSSNMPIDSTESLPPRSATTHGQEVQTRPDPDHNALVEAIIVSNTPSLLPIGSRTDSIASLFSSAPRQESANTSLDVTTALLLASALDYRAIPQCSSPPPLELSNSPGILSQSIADPPSDERQVYAAF